MEVRPMRTKTLILNSILILLISAAFIFTGCKKEQQTETEQLQEVTEAETSLTEKLEQDVKDVIKPIETKEAELKKGVDALLAEVNKRKQELRTKEEELKAKATELEEKALQLTEQENSIKAFRTGSWLLFILGAILFLVGLVFILVARKKTAPQREEKKGEKEQQKLTKAAEKEEKKTEKTLKKDTPPKN